MAQRVSDRDGLDVPSVPWSTFLRGDDRQGVPPVLSWRQGEHVSLIGPTGGGKTTLALGILPSRRFTVIYASKPRDRTLDGLTRGRRSDRFRKVTEWPPPARTERVILWPKGRDLATERRRQQATFHDANRAIYSVGSWCVFADDMWYLCNPLKLAADFETLWANGRSIGVSLVAAIQRPAHVPLMAYDQATHLFFWRDNDESNLRRIGGIGFADSRRIRKVVAGLPRHETLYVNARTGAMVRTRVER